MATAGGATLPAFIVPDGWVVDESVEFRLRHRLAGASSSVVGIAALGAPLPAGATYRTFADRASLLAGPLRTDHEVGPVAGAVVLRPGVSHRLVPGGVEVTAPRGGLLVDPGAPSYDPGGAPGSLEAATATARSPFPRRPVVVFLGCDADAHDLAWSQAMINELVARHVDACLASTRIPEGPHLARPCLATRQSVLALHPDVVVTLDDGARADLPEWLAGGHRTLVIDHTPDPAVGVDLEGGRLGAGRGPVRAIVGRAAEADRLAEVVDRLCGGPHPISADPVARDRGAGQEWREELSAAVVMVTPRRRRASDPRTLRVMALDATAGSGPVSGRLGALADRMVESGHNVSVSRSGGALDHDLAGGDTIILHGMTPSGDVLEAVDVWSRAGRVVSILLSADDIEEVGPDGARVIRFTDGASSLIRACGRAIAPNRSVAALVDDPEVAVIAPGPMITRAEEAAFRKGSASGQPVGSTICWQVDDPDPAERSAIGEALSLVLDDRADLSVELWGPATVTDLADRHRSRVRVIGHSEPGGDRVPARGDRPVAQVWSAGDLASCRLAGGGPLVTSGYRGVPTVVSAHNVTAGQVDHPVSLRVDEPTRADAWLAKLAPLLDDPAVRRSRSESVRRAVSSVLGSESSALAVDRLVGWLSSRSADGR